MTVTSTANTVTGIGNGATTVWPYTFEIPYLADGVTPAVVVQVTNTNVTPNVVTTLTPSQYAISGVGTGVGGNVTYSPAIAAGYLFTITRNVPYTQEISILNQGFFPKTVEAVADLLTMEIQQIANGFGRAVQGPPSDGSSVNMILQPAQSRKGYMLSFASSDGSVETVVQTGQVEAAVAAFLAGVTAGIATTNYASTLAAAKALYGAPITVVNGQAVFVSGRTLSNDGYGGTFVYKSTDSTTTFVNDGLGFVDNQGRRFFRNFYGAVNAGWFPLGADGVTDDTTVFSNMVTAAAGLPINCAGNYAVGAVNHAVDIELNFVGAGKITSLGSGAGFLRTANVNFIRARNGQVIGDGVAGNNQYFVVGSTTFSCGELLMENMVIGGHAVCVDGSGALTQVANNVVVQNTAGTTSGHGYGWDCGEYLSGSPSATRFISFNGFLGDNVTRHDLYCGAGIGGKIVNAASIRHRQGIARAGSPLAAFVSSRMSNVSWENCQVTACNDAPFEISNDTQESLQSANVKMDISVLTTPYGGVVGYTGTPQSNVTQTSNLDLHIRWIMPATNNGEIVDVYWCQIARITLDVDFSASTSATNVGAIIRGTNNLGPYGVTLDGYAKIKSSADALAELTADVCNAASDGTVLFAPTARCPGGKLFLSDTDVQNPGIVALNNPDEKIFNAGGALFMYGYNKGVIAVGAPTNVTAIWSNSPYPTRIRTGDANTTFVNSAALRLAGATNFAAPATEFMLFEAFDATHTFELSRSHDA